MGVLDLTTLQSTDTPERVGALCARARDPLGDGSATVAAVCVYPTLVPAAAEALAGSPVRVASVAGAFPSGMSPLHLRVAEAAWCVQQGAQEIDMVISRGEFLAGRFDAVVEEVAQVRQAIGQATLKVILEVGQLGSPQAITRASELVVAQLRDGDFIKTSTGKEGPGASLEATACMLAVLANAWRNGGPKVGLKPAGGVRTTEQAVAYWRQACEAMSAFEPWRRPDPRVFRLGASSLLDDLARAIADRSAG
ncbi:MAG: deoxyribose-phosphate aldolase [Phycisphaerales bacterium]|nr:MAG: deoxyribose-phosphate aldolase [Phycisphaerales bacterium]